MWLRLVQRQDSSFDVYGSSPDIVHPKVCSINRVVDFMNGLGRDGWELISVVGNSESYKPESRTHGMAHVPYVLDFSGGYELWMKRIRLPET